MRPAPMPSDRDPPREGDPKPLEDRAPGAATAEYVRGRVQGKETQRALRGLVAKQVPFAQIDDVTADIVVEVLAAAEQSPPDRADAADDWILTIARRVIADFLTKRRRREKYEGPMPSRPERDDAGGASESDGLAGRPASAEDAASAGDGVPAADAWAAGSVFEPVAAEPQDDLYPWMVRQWIEREVASNPRDRETFAMILEHVQGSRPYSQIAAERGLEPRALHDRVFEFKSRYRPRYERWRRNLEIVLFLLGGVAVAVVVAIVVWLLSQPPQIRPDIAPPRPRPVAPVPSTSASDEPFEPALPTPPRQSPPPRPPRVPLKPGDAPGL
jgi:DNA-directed RNA polymerase specialized sigma24 family protein